MKQQGASTGGAQQGCQHTYLMPSERIPVNLWRSGPLHRKHMHENCSALFQQ